MASPLSSLDATIVRWTGPTSRVRWRRLSQSPLHSSSQRTDAIVLHNSNKLALRLLPCDVFARVTYAGREVANLEVELATRLADVDGPVAALEVRVELRVYEGDR
jgi:hypothetical protein